MGRIPARIPGREREEFEDKLYLSNSSDKQGELAIYAGTAGEVGFEIFNGSDSAVQVLTTAAALSMRLQSVDELEPTLIFKTTKTAHQMNVYLDEDMVNDELVIAGQTASKNTCVDIKAKDGENAAFYLYSGTKFSYLSMLSDDRLMIANNNQDKDIFFQIDDGGTTRTITWDADVDKLKHSGGTFNFDNDNLETAGVFKVSGNQVVGARVVDQRIDDAVNSGDATTDGVIDAMRDALISHGLIRAI